MRGLDVPSPTEDFTADPVELFFDLAFVFAFSRLVAYLVHHPTWTGAYEAGLLFLILWLAWSTFTWAANAVQGNARAVRAVFLLATAVSVPMGASVSVAFGSGGVMFAVGVSLIVFMGIGLQIWGLASDETTSSEFRSIVRYGIPNALASVFLVIGAFLDEGPRKLCWLLFLVVVLGGMVGARFSDWIVRPGHFSERHGLIVIIALGEVIVAIGIAVVTSFDADVLPIDKLVTLGAAGMMAGLLWWGYFDRLVPAVEHRAAELAGRERSRFIADVYTGFHAFIVGGIITTAAATEEILLHPLAEVHGEFLVMFVGGLALFSGGIVASAYRAYRVVAQERLLGIAAIALVVYFGRSWDGVTILIITDIILFVTILTEHVRIEAPSPAV